MRHRCHLALATALLAAACAPPETRLSNPHLMRAITIFGDDGEVHARATLTIDSDTAFDCAELAGELQLTVGADTLALTSRGGVDDTGACAPAVAIGPLSTATLQSPAALIATDGTTSLTMPLWTALTPRWTQLVTPADAVLEPDVPFTLAWPYPVDDTELTLVLAPYQPAIVAVADGVLTAAYPALPGGDDPEADDDADLELTAEQDHIADCGDQTCTWRERWVTTIAVTTWSAPRPR
jgi:hypothetical protein